MTLLELPGVAPHDGQTCHFGEPWMGPHPLCAAAVDRDCARFDEKVAAGIFDAEGYTPKERRAGRRRQLVGR